MIYLDICVGLASKSACKECGKPACFLTGDQAWLCLAPTKGYQ